MNDVRKEKRRRHKRLEELSKNKSRRQQAATLYREGQIPMSFQRVRGLWVVLGRDGHFVPARPGSKDAVRAFNAHNRLTIVLAPIAEDSARELLWQHAEREHQEIPF